jgi:hypothetical protein
VNSFCLSFPEFLFIGMFVIGSEEGEIMEEFGIESVKGWYVRG